MCGRYLVITEDEIIEMKSILEELNQRFSDLDNDILNLDRSENSEMFPGAITPVMVLHEHKIVIQPMKWGFSRCDGKGVVINAKAESVNEKSFFRDSFTHNRCIVPSRGFFEWKKPSSDSAFYSDANSTQPSQLDFDSVFGLFPKVDSVSTPSSALSKSILPPPSISTPSSIFSKSSLTPPLVSSKSASTPSSIFSKSVLAPSSVFSKSVSAPSSVFSKSVLNPSSISYKSVSIPPLIFCESGMSSLDKDTSLSPGKYLIREANSPLFLMAGIYQQAQGTNEFTILTMPANTQVSPLHDRMPVFLEKSQLLPWLLDPKVLKLLLENQISSLPFLIQQFSTSKGRI